MKRRLEASLYQHARSGAKGALAGQPRSDACCLRTAKKEVARTVQRLPEPLILRPAVGRPFVDLSSCWNDLARTAAQSWHMACFLISVFPWVLGSPEGRSLADGNEGDEDAEEAVAHSTMLAMAHLLQATTGEEMLQLRSQRGLTRRSREVLTEPSLKVHQSLSTATLDQVPAPPSAMLSRLWGFVQSITSKRPSSEEAPPAKRARVQTSVESNAPEAETARPATAFASQASGPPVEYKLVLLGDAGVGKTCFVKRHVTGEFVKKYRPTEGCEMKKLKISTSRGPVLFQVWDTAGQDHLAGLRDGYFIGAQCAMVFFDVTKRESHQNLAKWVTDLRKVAGDIPVVVVGNKVDAPGRVVKAQEGSVIMRKLKVQYYDLSVRTRFNVEVPLLFLSRRLLGDSSLRALSAILYL
ncbi:GTP-binding nuclear protein Ran [Symbiodinium microadriaticum]|uniref:GTP-binding nuclear protein Ran n=1 Tax=Symbiodinium microadriaticum TaxID=2951 RepID=A0A1Q9DSU5_SYMMI|nr:GTP-binding nuclear protein Ran [Symbiodinium microadriaticum]